MINILFIGAVTALAGAAILAKVRAGRPKKADKWEKAEIIKRLLALSESENGIPAGASSAANRLRPASNSAICSAAGQNSKRKHSSLSPATRSSVRPNQTDVDLEKQIRQRAYELYQQRGRDGNPNDDWLQAKKEVLSRKAKAGGNPS
jgi:hypothetical protein